MAVEPELADAAAGVVPRLTPGVELIGEYQGSGFQQSRFLVRRADGQVIQLSRLLYLLATAVDGQRDLVQVAATVSEQFGRVVLAPQVLYLVNNRLRPVGLVVADPQAGTEAPTKIEQTSDPLLALRFRVAVIPKRAVWRIGGVFAPLFWPPVILAAVAGFIGLDGLLLARGALAQTAPSTLALVYQPTSTLWVLAMILASAAFHECGHVTACRYGGATPGVMGFGVYLVWPAFYSIVTDSYRLSRIGRLRTDLGGVYFNAVSIAGMSLAYLGTGASWLLVAVVALHIETAMQFLPIVRMDGYYILSDLVGVPDLFSRMGPVLKSMIPGGSAHPRVTELKPWVRRTITLWVAIVVPTLLYWAIRLVIGVPRVLPVAYTKLLELSHATSAAAAAGNIPKTTVDVVQVVLLLLPWTGLLLLFSRLAQRPARLILAHWSTAQSQAQRPLSPTQS